MSYAPGSLVRARGREWVVLPDSTDDLLLLKPLGGLEDDVAGLLPQLEVVEPASFALPSDNDLGDHRSARLLRDAVRLGFRSSAGPFRSFGRIAVEPRSYQLVPLLMALRLDPVRLLIADDVGIGKTVEALLIAKELLDRGEVRRTAVLCPPHLAEQWQEEMLGKFNIEAEVVLSGTVRRLERHCRFNESLFEHYPHVVVSLDFIKSDRRRAEFLRSCPEFVIVDEAHTCAGVEGSGRHQRHELIAALAADPNRHLTLVTATPHSGKEESFISLVGLLSPRLGQLAADLSHADSRRALAAHLVQRRRGDIRRFLEQDTVFPDRLEREATWALTNDYRHLFERVLAWARESVRDTTGGRHRQRVRWWSALALLRALGSSPAAAAATLRTRAAADGTSTAEEADEVGMSTVLDLDLEGAGDQGDMVPGAVRTSEGDGAGSTGRRLLEFATAADRLRGNGDPKLQGLVPIIEDLLKEGFSPIVFCRFIQTAEYVASELARRVPRDITVGAVTGLLPPEEREARVGELADQPRRILVCTDCLSEGINLQRSFDAVVHYDLSWNPTRHEQRDGRVDRFGQDSGEVRIITYFGVDNRIDGIVLDVLLRKHREIRRATGVAVPVPGDSNEIIEAIFEGLLLREEHSEGIQEYLPGFEELLRPKREDLHRAWEDASAREGRSRTMFAQDSLKPEDVLPELAATRDALGEGGDLRDFVIAGVHSLGGSVQDADTLVLDLKGTPPPVRDLVPHGTLKARFDLPVEGGVQFLHRTHPFVEGLAAHLLDGALDPASDSPARRAAAIRTRAVASRTTLLVVRHRFQIQEDAGGTQRVLLAEDVRLAAFRSSPDNAEWLTPTAAEALLRADPDENIDPELARDFVGKVVSGIDWLLPELERQGAAHASDLLSAHRRVRSAARRRGVRFSVSHESPPDILGIYVFLPVGA